MPEPTLDLDRAFAHLTRDVSGVSTGRGAGAAVRTARRRRTATGLVAAVALVAAVSTGAALLTGAPGGVDPATVPDHGSSQPLEPVPPAELTPDALSAATASWVDGWRVAPSPVLTDAPCLSEDVAEPADYGTEELRSGPVGASRTFGTYLSVAEADEAGAVLRAGFADCADGGMPVLGTFEAAGADVTAYAFPEDADPDGAVWVAVAADRIGILTVAGVDGPPEDVVDAVSRALVAGLGYDEP